MGKLNLEGYNQKLPVAKHLSDQEYHVLLTTYAKHNACMGLKYKEKYSLSHIVKVERNVKDDCLNVHYDNGDWWKYYSDGTWG